MTLGQTDVLNDHLTDVLIESDKRQLESSSKSNEEEILKKKTELTSIKLKKFK